MCGKTNPSRTLQTIFYIFKVNVIERNFPPRANVRSNPAVKSELCVRGLMEPLKINLRLLDSEIQRTRRHGPGFSVQNIFKSSKKKKKNPIKNSFEKQLRWSNHWGINSGRKALTEIYDQQMMLNT